MANDGSTEPTGKFVNNPRAPAEKIWVPDEAAEIVATGNMPDNELEQFKSELVSKEGEEDVLDFCRKFYLHGTPFVFRGNEDDFYSFRKRIAKKFDVNFNDINITGSAKLGFSPHKDKQFDYDSDIDVAIVSEVLFDRMMDYIWDYQMQLRENRKTVSENELSKYHTFLEYGAIGWMRPDLLPSSFRVSELREDWFQFFESISHGKSEVGNYKVTAGVFKNQSYLERYVLSGLLTLRSKLKVKIEDVESN